MRRWFAVPVSIMLASPLVALADDVASVKKQVEADLAKSITAFKKHDIKGMSSMVADDYEGVGMDGKKMNKAQMQAQMKQYMNDTKKINSAKYSVAGLRLEGGKALGMTTFNLDAVVIDSQGMLGQKGKTHHMVIEEHTNVTWTKSGGGWKVSKEAAVGMPKMVIDGKPFNPMAMGGPPKKK